MGKDQFSVSRSAPRPTAMHACSLRDPDSLKSKRGTWTPVVAPRCCHWPVILRDHDANDASPVVGLPLPRTARTTHATYPLSPLHHDAQVHAPGSWALPLHATGNLHSRAYTTTSARQHTEEECEDRFKPPYVHTVLSTVQHRSISSKHVVVCRGMMYGRSKFLLRVATIRTTCIMM